ncbi:hypothetical protein GCM10025868_32310 [Angustibacter aerolatus]|uniref:Carbohydrate kinase FGGY C-terminal domain-containing protein n=1 Tax=Angustibacter aerolatus TaxID=1162965 RepID=A0ABQ6JMN7_9ACTN|nr:FGGY family carbohydrate kinase [Angustibacter aerolatus]GMA87981.1 hypothetical protein GCM10025868_32310 [Angustibacter aerolatus]
MPRRGVSTSAAGWCAGWAARRCSSLSLAGRTGWLDVAARDWWDDALAWSGATRALMPPLVAAGVPVGAVSADVSPLLRGAVLTLAGHDHQAAALGARADDAGAELDSAGTAEALVRTIADVPDRADVARLARGGITTDPSIRPGCWTLLGGTEGGLAQNRALDLLGVGPDGLAALDAAAEHAPSGRVVVGGLGGDALTLGGLAGGVGPGEVWRAVVDAAADQALALHRAMDDVVGPAERVVVTGGWRHSAQVMRAKAARFGRLQASEVEEAGALGAAVLAARAVGALGPDEPAGGTVSDRPLFADERQSEVLRLLTAERRVESARLAEPVRGERRERAQGPRAGGGARPAAAGARRRRPRGAAVRRGAGRRAHRPRHREVGDRAAGAAPGAGRRHRAARRRHHHAAAGRYCPPTATSSSTPTRCR